MVNAFLTGASYKLFKSLPGDAQRRASSNIVFEQKITYHPLFIAFFHKLISMQRCWAYVAFKYISTAAITLILCASELSPISDKDAELNR